jgi:hypothetical protein
VWLKKTDKFLFLIYQHVQHGQKARKEWRKGNDSQAETNEALFAKSRFASQWHKKQSEIAIE